MKKQYPLISSAARRSQNTTKLCRCGEIATHKVEIQTSYMRGDDEYEWACSDHVADVKFLTANWGREQVIAEARNAIKANLSDLRDMLAATKEKGE